MRENRDQPLLMARIIGASVVLALIGYVIAGFWGAVVGLAFQPAMYGVLYVWSKNVGGKRSSKFEEDHSYEGTHRVTP